jgi:hypothetical protein
MKEVAYVPPVSTTHCKLQQHIIAMVNKVDFRSIKYVYLAHKKYLQEIQKEGEKALQLATGLKSSSSLSSFRFLASFLIFFLAKRGTSSSSESSNLRLTFSAPDRDA